MSSGISNVEIEKFNGKSRDDLKQNFAEKIANLSTTAKNLFSFTNQFRKLRNIRTNYLFIL